MPATRYSIALASVALLAAGCLRKEKIESCPGQCTIVNGRLLTSSRQPLADAPVSVSWLLRGGILGGGVLRTRGRTTTDANGNFQFSFYVQDDELHDGYFTVNYEVDKTRYYLIGDDHDALFDIKRDTTYQLRPYLIPRKASVQLTVPNAGQVQGYAFIDFVSAYGNDLSATKNSLGGGSVYQVTNQTSSFTTTTDVAADQPLYVKLSKTVNGVSVRTVDSLVVPAGTTRNLTVRY